jgi:hypothetical protein
MLPHGSLEPVEASLMRHCQWMACSSRTTNAHESTRMKKHHRRTDVGAALTDRPACNALSRAGRQQSSMNGSIGSIIRVHSWFFHTDRLAMAHQRSFDTLDTPRGSIYIHSRPFAVPQYFE